MTAQLLSRIAPVLSRVAGVGDLVHRIRYRRAVLLRTAPVQTLANDDEVFTHVAVASLPCRPAVALTCPVRSSVAYQMALPANATVVAWCGLADEVGARGSGGVVFEMLVRTQGAEASARLVVRAGARFGRSWRTLRVRAPGKGSARIVLTTKPADDTAHAVRGVWGNPSVEWPRSLADLLWLVRSAVAEHGLRGLWFGMRPVHGERLYRLWVREQLPSLGALRAQRRWSRDQPRVFTIITLIRDSATWQSSRTRRSMEGQTYPGWEWILVATDAAMPGTERATARARLDARVRLIDVPAAGSRSDAWNAALASARGDYVALLDQDDVLEPDALYEVARMLDSSPDCDLVYSDHDLIERRNQRRHDPHFKPEWSPEYLLSFNYIGRLAMMRSSVVAAVGGFRNGVDGAEEWDLLLRAYGPTARVRRLPRCLYHRDAAWNAGPSDGEAAAIRDHYARLGLRAEVSYAHGTWRGVWPASSADRQPLVSVVIPNRNAAAVLKMCVRGLLHETSYRRHELVIVDNGSTEREVLGLYRTIEDGAHGRIVPFNRPFNFSAACNAGAAAARGDLLLFLNNDIEVIGPDWLDELVRWAERPGIGVVGAKLLYPNRTIQHAGVAFGPGGLVDHIFSKAPEGASSVFGSPEGYRNYLAVTAACQMMRKDVFERVGGFDERFRLSFSDVVLCMEAGRAGFRVVYTPYARLIHHESYSRKREDSAHDIEQLARYLRARSFTEDPYFHPELSSTSLVPVVRPPFDPTPGRAVSEFVERVLAAADPASITVQEG